MIDDGHGSIKESKLCLAEYTLIIVFRCTCRDSLRAQSVQCVYLGLQGGVFASFD